VELNREEAVAAAAGAGADELGRKMKGGRRNFHGE